MDEAPDAAKMDCENYLETSSPHHEFNADFGVEETATRCSSPAYRIEVYWQLDVQYYPGTASTVSEGITHIDYDDGEKEQQQISNETWRLVPSLTSSCGLQGHVLKVTSSKYSRQWLILLAKGPFNAIIRRALIIQSPSMTTASKNSNAQKESSVR